MDAQNRIGKFLDDVYNAKRIHSSLGYKTSLSSTSVLLANAQIVSSFMVAVHLLAIPNLSLCSIESTLIASADIKIENCDCKQIESLLKQKFTGVN